MKAERFVSWCVVIALGAAQTIATAFVVDADGISYLTLADLYVRGDWAAAANGHWAAGYPLLLAATRILFGVPVAWEGPMAHTLNFAIYLASFGTFRLFLAELRTAQIERKRLEPGRFQIRFDRPVELVAAHALFLWSALVMIGLWYLRPDMLIALIVYGIAALTLRLRTLRASAASYVLLGAFIGLGYWTKMVMFPLGIVIILTCAIGAGGWAPWRRKTLAAAAGFGLLASPQIYSQSQLAGRFSYGETGTFAYAQYVNRVPQYWTGDPPGSGVARHPVRRIHDVPAAYAFSSPVSLFSYPYRDQPAYWADGMRPRFDLREQVAVTVPILAMYLELLFVLLIAVAALVVFSRGGVLPVFLPVMIPAAGAFGLYALLHAESRFLGAFAVVLFLCASASFVFPSTRHRAVMVVLALVAALNAFMLGYETLFLVRQASGSAEGTAADGNQFGVASILHSSGIPAGAKVASIGFSYNAYWARLAGVQIAMEIPDAASYWASSDSVKAIVHKRFAESGAVAIVANRFLPAAPPSGWKRLGDSRYYLLPLAAARGHAASRNPR